MDVNEQDENTRLEIFNKSMQGPDKVTTLPASIPILHESHLCWKYIIELCKSLGMDGSTQRSTFTDVTTFIREQQQTIAIKETIITHLEGMKNVNANETHSDTRGSIS
jgi:hypothetical protein